MFKSAELGHKIDKHVYDKEIPVLRKALLDAQFNLVNAANFQVIILVGGVAGAGRRETINLLNELGGVVLKGNGISGKLGTTITPTNSIEGRVASVVYNKVEGSYVFRRITPIVGMLIYAGICQNTGRYLSFLPQFMPHEN